MCAIKNHQHLFLQHFSIENNEQHAAASTSKQQRTLSWSLKTGRGSCWCVVPSSACCYLGWLIGIILARRKLYKFCNASIFNICMIEWQRGSGCLTSVVTVLHGKHVIFKSPLIKNVSKQNVHMQWPQWRTLGVFVDKLNAKLQIGHPSCSALSSQLLLPFKTDI